MPGIAGTGPLRSMQPSLSPRKTFKGTAAGSSSPQPSVSFCLSLIIDDRNHAAGRARSRRAQFHPGPISGTPKRKSPSACSALVGALSVFARAAQHAWRSSTRNQTPPPHLDSRSPPCIWTPSDAWLDNGILFGKQILVNIGHVVGSGLKPFHKFFARACRNISCAVSGRDASEKFFATSESHFVLAVASDLKRRTMVPFDFIEIR